MERIVGLDLCVVRLARCLGVVVVHIGVVLYLSILFVHVCWPAGSG